MNYDVRIPEAMIANNMAEQAVTHIRIVLPKVKKVFGNESHLAAKLSLLYGFAKL